MPLVPRQKCMVYILKEGIGVDEKRSIYILILPNVVVIVLMCTLYITNNGAVPPGSLYQPPNRGAQYITSFLKIYY